MHKILFYDKFVIRLYMCRALCAHHQEVKTVLYSISASGIITLVGMMMPDYTRQVSCTPHPLLFVAARYGSRVTDCGL